MSAPRPTFAAAAILLASMSAAVAGPTYTFSTSVGTQPSSVGSITLTQVDANTVNVLLDLSDTTLPAPRYGLVNTGGPHTPFAFTLAGPESGVSATFLQPVAGSFALGVFTLSTSDGDNSPYGTYGLSIESSAGNGSANAYYGDLQFDLRRIGGLDTSDFIQNASGYFFSADMTNGSATGAQAWAVRDTPGNTPVPEPMSIALFGIGLAGVGVIGVRAATRWRGQRG